MKLEELGLQDTGITALPSMANMTSLRVLDLNGCSSLVADEAFISNLSPALVTLHLNAVPLNLTHLRAASLPQLAVLNLNVMPAMAASNTLPAGFLANMPSLQHLSFRGVLHDANQDRVLSAVVFSGPAGCGSLDFLDLHGSGFTAIEDNAFAQCSLLRTLDLQDNFLTAISATSFTGLVGLTDLALNNNAIASIAEGAWDSLRRLERLNLYSNQLRYLPGFGSALGNNAPLKLIRVYDNDLTEFPVSILTRSAALTHLEAQNNEITSFPWEIVRTAFRQFDLSGNHITTVPALHNLLETAIDSTFDVSHNELTNLPESFLQFVGRWGTIDVSFNNISIVARTAMARHIAFPWKPSAGVLGGKQDSAMSFHMHGNPSVCKYEGNSLFKERFDRFTLECTCATDDDITAADTYCESRLVVPCPVGQYLLESTTPGGENTVRQRHNSRDPASPLVLHCPLPLSANAYTMVIVLTTIPCNAHCCSAHRARAAPTPSHAFPSIVRQLCPVCRGQSTTTTTPRRRVSPVIRPRGATSRQDLKAPATILPSSASLAPLTTTATLRRLVWRHVLSATAVSRVRWTAAFKH